MDHFTGTIADSPTLLNIFQYCAQKMSTDSTGHDHWHHYRVYKNSVAISQELHANEFCVAAASLLHDIYRAEEKAGEFLHYSNDAIELIKNYLLKIAVEKSQIDIICNAIADHELYPSPSSLSAESKALQDADRLDALGAVGIARCFAFSGANKLPIWQPTEDINQFDPDLPHQISHNPFFRETT